MLAYGTVPESIRERTVAQSVPATERAHSSGMKEIKLTSIKIEINFIQMSPFIHYIIIGSNTLFLRPTRMNLCNISYSWK